MGRALEIFTPLHTRTSRDYVGRMTDDKIHCMQKAKEYEVDYWDGDRRYGYGGYRYDGRWKPVAERLIELYSLADNARILDVGCGKAHLLYELNNLLPAADLTGFDISRHGIGDAPEAIREQLHIRRAEDEYPWKEKEFDLVLSLGCLHNLRLPELEQALREVERVGKRKFVMMESYRNEAELFNLQCWALTCESFLSPDEWLWLFDKVGYAGDYEFIFFE